jgi:phenylpropionate dioxygenase-like ring-hydroxylating dioxygenase large terminal subunit
LNEPIVFYRTESGEPVALWGLCPHRLAPLDLGQLKGDSLRCGYHGFTFSPEGACIDIPVAKTRPELCRRLKKYPLVEMGPWIWIWMGDSEAPDYSKLPNIDDIGLGNNATGWRVDVTERIFLKARAQLLIDNLFDLSHIAFIHANSFPPGTNDIALVKPFMKKMENVFRVGRWVRGVPFVPGAMHSLMLPDATGKADLLLHTDFYNVGFVNGSGPWMWRSNDDGSQGEELAKLNFVHCITPETEHTTHYFGVLTRNIRLNDDAFSKELMQQSDFIRGEDRAMLEEIESRGAVYGDPTKEVSVFSDAGAMRIRQMIQAMFKTEARGEKKEPREATISVVEISEDTSSLNR